MHTLSREAHVSMVDVPVRDKVRVRVSRVATRASSLVFHLPRGENKIRLPAQPRTRRKITMMEYSLSQRHIQSDMTEKGSYEIYSHRRYVEGPRRRRLNLMQYFANTPTEKLLTAIIGILFMLMCMSFIWAYYLFSSGCVVSVIPFSRPQSSRSSSDSSASIAKIPVVVDLDRNPGSLEREPTTKYLSYLPHSGFHNQRIAFENALVMARILNRTLLVPPVRLGKGILTYYPFEHLYELVALMGKGGLGHCTNVSAWKALPVECSD